MKNDILILDFGSQYSQIILRKLRELKISAEMISCNTDLEIIKQKSPKGIIFSGSPYSVYEKDAPAINPEIFNLGIPILGICYGLQLIVKLYNGEVEKSSKREFGKAHLNILKKSDLLENVPDNSIVWMSHSDKVTKISEEFETLAKTSNSEYAVIGHKTKKIFGLQFHPEVKHSEYGLKILENFSKKICNCQDSWLMDDFILRTINEIREKASDKKVLCALSGGVDSTVAATLAHKAIGNNLICLHIDNGLMRKNESQKVLKIFNEKLNLNVQLIDASEIFLSRLKGVTDPEEKRKIIGNTFIEVFENEIKKIGDIEYLIQGTLFPDLIESTSYIGPSSVIKTHHNVGGLPEKMNLKLIEPLRELFKDEVRIVGKLLEIPADFLDRHPFPGPGLAVRILGEVTKEKLELLRDADEIFISELRKTGNYHNAWQAFCVLLPVKTVGVMGDSRTYEYTIAIRAVNSVDGMTAEAVSFDINLLKDIANKIVNEVKGINRVVYDLTSKPPSTIEWE